MSLTESLAKQAAELSAGLPRIIRAADFCANPPPTPPEVIEGVLHRGGKAVYGGPSKANKTWCLLDMCMSVASGVPWMGFPTAQGPALYVNMELQGFAEAKRLKAIVDAKGLPGVPPALSLWNLRGYARPLPELLPDLLDQIRGAPYALIVIDPIYKTLNGRDENAAGDMAAVMNELERVAVETGAAVAFGAHFAKGNASGKASIDRMSGSGVFARDPDAIITATPHEVEGAFTIEMTLRNFPQPCPFAVEWDFPLMVRAGHLDPAKLKVAGGRPATHSVSDVTKLLEKTGSTTTEWQRAAEVEGISKSSFYRLKKQAEESGFVVSGLGGRWLKSQKCQKSQN
jgi:hypothetical protein